MHRRDVGVRDSTVRFSEVIGSCCVWGYFIEDAASHEIMSVIPRVTFLAPFEMCLRGREICSPKDRVVFHDVDCGEQ